MRPQQQGISATKSPWQKTNFANLIRYEPSGTYFARIRIAGKFIRKSLNTKTLSVAKLKLTDFEKQERSRLERRNRMADGKVIFRDLLAEYRIRLHRDHTIKPRAKTYREECIARLLKTWPGLESADARKISEGDCLRWAGDFVRKSSPTAFNNTVGTLRMILEIAVENGARYRNPAKSIQRAKPRTKELALPSQDEFQRILAEIRSVPYGPALASADLVEFLACGGFRKGEAKFITWSDCDFDRGEVIVRGHPETGPKNSEIRRIPNSKYFFACLTLPDGRRTHRSTKTTP